MADESQNHCAAKAAEGFVERRGVEDGTAFWTLSFYISRAQVEGSDLALQLYRSDFRTDGDAEGDKQAFDQFDIARFFIDHPDPSARARHDAGPPRDDGPFLSRERLNSVRPDSATRQLREAINPLFNDIADRSRLGRIEDELFAAARPQGLAFVLPREVQWSTEGQTYTVPTFDPADPKGRPPRYPIHVSRFWYAHSNGALSWHVSFDVRYRNAAFDEALAHGLVPHGLYLLSLMQKLAYPKERELPGDGPTLRSDELFGLSIAVGEGDDGRLFWDVLRDWFEEDVPLLGAMHSVGGDLDFHRLCPLVPINEIPGLLCQDTRSSFFLQDKQFFELIQPKNGESGALVERRTRIRDAEFGHYPALVDAGASNAPVTRDPNTGAIVLGRDYWRAMQREPEGLGEAPVTDAATRLLYLFLAGFNQNIIDWTNQEASEVLDSLDPIYPRSDEQLEEGFFIRYANPRCLISYVQRSRTLEVGNDFIGTCPYAFLIHALALHNERLTRDQEKLAFAVVEKVNSFVKEAQRRQREAEQGIGDLVMRAEAWINWYRMAAFELFDRQRYANPFRYDTERDVFGELEKLRGTSRLQLALDRAFDALEESARDLERVRVGAEREGERRADLLRLAQQQEADAAEKLRDRKMTALFGLVGLSGVGQLAFNIYEYVMHPVRSQQGWGIFVELLNGQLDARDAALIVVQSVIAIAFIAGLSWYIWPSSNKARRTDDVDAPPGIHIISSK
ncbi:hypothetical protein [Novosphingobium sp. JCM 18896]|uniref:hypothetical protein n=1 Tax=Novosphingobium sp. JCM 18896 TaxID=2989731 RepID=UPI0022225533|nr:hypothetical protein [Novosphingobium sp. JCM 18896]MCW1432092.1 hypothetical protein [Novosphingobium sp. JCM 18896]